MSEYFQVSLPGGDDRPIFCNPPRTLDSIRSMYPQALAVIAISKADFLKLCERMHRVVMV